MTPEEKLAAVERCIEDFRWTRDNPEDHDKIEYQTYLAMCEIAAELRKGVPTAAGPALTELQRRIDTIDRSKTEFGYSINALKSAAEELVGRWPTVRAALERFEKEPA